MFQEIRRQDRMLSQEEAVEILKNGVYGFLSLNSRLDNEYAYGVPISYVFTNNCIYLHCAVEGEKLRRLRNNNKVSFCVVQTANPMPDKFSVEFSSAIVFGTATEVIDEEKFNLLLAFVDKYSVAYKEKGAQYAVNGQNKTIGIRIDIDCVTGKARKK
jgi:Predicted flavin-nucleotide-binding protein